MLNVFINARSARGGIVLFFTLKNELISDYFFKYKKKTFMIF